MMETMCLRALQPLTDLQPDPARLQQQQQAQQQAQAQQAAAAPRPGMGYPPQQLPHASQAQHPPHMQQQQQQGPPGTIFVIVWSQ